MHEVEQAMSLRQMVLRTLNSQVWKYKTGPISHLIQSTLKKILAFIRPESTKLTVDSMGKILHLDNLRDVSTIDHRGKDNQN